MEQRNYRHIMLSFLLIFVSNASFAMMPDFFAEASSANQNRGATSLAPNEVIDTFSGGLSIVHTDLVIPGNGGLDIRIQRSYSSNNVYIKPIGGMGSTYQRYVETSPYGLGWSMHFGRVRMSADYFDDDVSGWQVFESCPPTSSLPKTLDNPYLEMPDGSQRQLFCNNFPSTYSTNAHFITKDNWVVTPVRATPTSGTTGFLVIDPNGTKYSMNRRLRGGPVARTQYVWYTTKIQDANNNSINIEYDNLSGLESPIYRRITASDGRVVTFAYADRSSAGNTKLVSITSGSRKINYTMTSFRPPYPIFGGRSYRLLKSVDLPGNSLRTGVWSYNYHTKPAGDAGNSMLSRITYPQGATTSYDYEYKCLIYSTCSVVNQYVSIVLKSKVNAGRGIQTGRWGFVYTVSSDENYNIVTVTGPTTVEEYRHFKVNKRISGNTFFSNQTPNLWRVGLLETKTTRGLNGALLQTEVYTYGKRTLSAERYERPPYTQAIGLSDTKTYQHFLTAKTVNRDGVNYVTRFENFADNINPHKITEVGQETRVTNLSYYPRVNGQNIVSRAKDETITNAANRKTTRTFDNKGNITAETQYGVKTTLTYDSQGNVASRKDSRNNTTRYSRYFRGVPRTEIRPENITLTRSVDGFGNVTRMTDGNGFVTNYSYDPINRPTLIDKPEGADTTISWSTSRRVVTRGSYQQTTSFDGLGRTTCTQTEGIYVGSSYDAVGNQRNQTYPNYTSCAFTNPGIRFTYDGLNRKLRTTHPDSSYQQVTFLANNRQRLRDERGKLFTNTYRSFGNPDNQELVGIIGPANLDVDIDRNILGQVTGVERNGVARTYNFGSSIFLQSEVNPETGTTIYGRDAVGNMVSKKVGASPTTTYIYDKVNRLTGTNYPGVTPDITQTYDKNSNLKRVISGIADINYSYDENNNLISERQRIASVNYFINYTYNDLDYLQSLTNPDAGVIDYAPNDLGWPSKAAPFVSNVVYNASGQPTSIAYQNGKTITHTYDVRRWPNRTTVNGRISDRSRTYDATGNLTRLDDRVNSRFDRVMSYDDLNRLSVANGAWGTGTISYNSSDDIIRKRMGTNNLGYNYNTSEKISSVSGLQNFVSSARYAYDVYGNVTSKANSTVGWTYQYDDASNLRKVFDKAGAELRQYDYSGVKQRVRSIKPDETRIHIVSKDGMILSEYVTQGTKPNITNVYLGNRLVAELEAGGAGPTTGPPATLFGWGFGNSANKYDYSRTFTLDERPDSFEYCVDGYGINSRTEVNVKLNGIVIGFLKPGGNPTTTCFDINVTLLRVGVNTVLFTQRRPVQTWGVGNFVGTSVFRADRAATLLPSIFLLLDDELQPAAQRASTSNESPANQEQAQ